MRWVRFPLAIGVACALVAFGAPAAAQALDACPLALSVAVICFDDLTDGIPIVLTNIPGASIAAGLESASVTFTGVTIAGPFPQSYALLETGGDFNPPNSDVATLFSSEFVVFQSDVFSSPPTFGPPVATLIEDGTFQMFSVGPNLDLFIRSDISGPEKMSEPPMLALLCVALAALGISRPRLRVHRR
jgi:hypothetical protein